MRLARHRTWVLAIGVLFALCGTALMLLLAERPGRHGADGPVMVEQAIHVTRATIKAAWYHAGHALDRVWLRSFGGSSLVLGMGLGMSLLAIGGRMTGWLRRMLCCRPQALPSAQELPSTVPVSAAKEFPPGAAEVLHQLIQSVPAGPAPETTGGRTSVTAWTMATESRVIVVAALDVAGQAIPVSAAAPASTSVAAPAPAPAPEQQQDVHTETAPAPAAHRTDHEHIAAEEIRARDESEQHVHTALNDAVAEHDVADAHGVPITECGAQEAAALLHPMNMMPSTAEASYSLDAWTNDDRALASATVVQRLLLAHALPDGLVALDVAGQQVQVFVDLPPAGMPSLKRLAHDLGSQQATWQVWADQGLMITLPEAPSLPPEPWPVLLPVLALQRDARVVRYVPTSRWPHLGLYGSAAIAVAHGLLTTLICQASPQTLGMQFLDAQQLLESAYRDAPHTVCSNTPASHTLRRILRDMQQGGLRELRPLVLVVVEPDETLMPLVASLLRLLRHQPHVPLHLWVVQSAMHLAGRDVYAMLRAGILTAPDTTRACRMPGVRRWPKAGRTIVFHHTVQWEGFPMTMDEGDARQVARSLPRGPYRLPPVIGERERSDAAKRLAAVVATAGRETAGMHGAAPPAGASTGNGSAHGTSVPAEVAPAALPATPVTPAAWPDADLAALVTCLTTDSAITGGQHPGVTRGRIQQALPEHLKAQARLALLWLEAAELLAPPLKPEDPYRHPRALRSLDPAVCSAALRATPVPERGSRTHTLGGG